MKGSHIYSLRKAKLPEDIKVPFSLFSDMEEISWMALTLYLSIKTENHQDWPRWLTLHRPAQSVKHRHSKQQK